MEVVFSFPFYFIFSDHVIVQMGKVEREDLNLYSQGGKGKGLISKAYQRIRLHFSEKG